MEIDTEIRTIYSFMVGFYQGVTITKINEMFLMDKSELRELYSRVRAKALEKIKELRDQ